MSISLKSPLDSLSHALYRAFYIATHRAYYANYRKGDAQGMSASKGEIYDVL